MPRTGLSLVAVAGAHAGAIAVIDEQHQNTTYDGLSHPTMFLILTSVILTLIFGGCCCGWLAHARLTRYVSKPHDATSTVVVPGPATTGARHRSGSSTPRTTDTGKQVEDHLNSLYLSFTIPELKGVCRRRGLVVTGIKSDIARRLVEAAASPTPSQAEEIVKTRQVLLTRGLDHALSIGDISTRDAAWGWLAAAQFKLSQRV